MKFRFVIIVSLAILLSACNFTMAADVTPPPGYVPPTPAPTLGPLFPAQAPSTENGVLIYAEKCAPCHGATGLGDGEQGIQLGVPVPAFGLPEVARSASPAQWYTVVTRGNMERFMPPFASLNDQERWDVVAYAMTLHIPEEELAKGKELFEASCENCSTDFFKDQAKMSELSEVELARLIQEGNDQVPAFGAALSDEDVWSVTAYLRTLSFDTNPIVAAPASTATPEAVTVTATVLPTEAGTPSAEGTPGATEQVPATSEATVAVQAGFGNVSGSIENKTGRELPSDLMVTLHGYDHGSDPSAGPEEVFTEEASVNEDGSFVFENIEIPERRIFVADLTFEGLDWQSGFAIVEAGNTSLTLPPITLYEKTEDTSALVIDETHIFFEYVADSVQVASIYSFHNPSDKLIAVGTNENQDIPFIKLPEGSARLGYELMQGSENLKTQDGLAIPPGENEYGVIAYASLPKAKEFEFLQEFVLPVPTVNIFVPEGVTLESDRLTKMGTQAIQDLNFQVYQLTNVGAGEKVTLAFSGTPNEGATASTPGEVAPNQNLLIGVGALGVALILAGAWMYLRDRNRTEEGDGAEEEADEFKSSEDVMDAILALDDLHRARKISAEAYQKRRAELKEILKGKM